MTAQPQTMVVTNFRQQPIRSARHMELVRFVGCMVPGCRRRYTDVHAHHIRRAGNSGTGVKPSDEWTMGLCSQHHRELHDHGEATCCARWGIDLMVIAGRIALASRLLGILPDKNAP